MTGEDAAAPLAEYERRTGKRALLFDGSALAGDEVDAFPRVYELFRDAFALGNGDADALALDGLALTDYGFEVNYAGAGKAAGDRDGCAHGARPLAGCDLLTGGDAYRQARKFPVGLLWDGAGLDSAAPIGVAGSWRFLCHLAKAVGLTLKPGAKSARDAFAAQMAPCADAIRRADVRVGVEGAGWYAYALADFLKTNWARMCA